MSTAELNGNGMSDPLPKPVPSPKPTSAHAAERLTDERGWWWLLARRFYRFPRPNTWRNRSAIDLAGLISTRVDLSGDGRFTACSAESVVRT